MRPKRINLFAPAALAAAPALALILSGGAQAQERVHGTLQGTYVGIDHERRVVAPAEDADALEGEGASDAASQDDVLEGAPPPRPLTQSAWRIRSSHIPADLEPRPDIPIGVWVDADIETERRSRPPRRRPPYGDRRPPRD
ncbi:MAG: hypothetical protein PVI23_00655 [Maricaulaceae bacterium]|jgi:hypothetical protein